MSGDEVILERVIRTETDLPVRFFREALNCAAPVGRIVVRDEQGQVVALATGFLVSEALLATCWHVIQTAETASRSEVQFDYLEKPDGSFAAPRIFRLDPSRVFISDAALDFTIVAVEPRNTHGDLLKARGSLSMDPRPGKAIVGEPLNVIHHGDGEPLRVSLRDNSIIAVTDNYLQYQGQARPGSAGAPVLNDRWELVGIHHAARSTRWGFFMEAIRVSSLLSHLLNLGATDVLQQLLAPGQLSSVKSASNTAERSELSRGNSSPPITREATTAGEVLALDFGETRPRDSVFLSYARGDQEENNWKDRLDVQLRAIARLTDLRVWHDGRIAAGADWRQEIRNALKSSRVAVLLIGPHFLTSDFIEAEELPVLLRDADSAGVKILPVITNFCPYSLSPLGRFQSVNDPRHPLESITKSEQNRILADVAEQVAALFQAGKSDS